MEQLLNGKLKTTILLTKYPIYQTQKQQQQEH